MRRSLYPAVAPSNGSDRFLVPQEMDMLRDQIMGIIVSLFIFVMLAAAVLAIH
jgi:hypothetical protein